MDSRGVSVVVLGMLVVAAAAAATGSTTSQLAAVRPVIGMPTTLPQQPVAGRPLTVSFRVTRSDSGRPLLGGRMVCDPSAAGKLIPHRESFRSGVARVSFVMPPTARLVRVRLTITLGQQAATRRVSFQAQELPSLSIADAATVEGNTGASTLLFKVRLSSASSHAVSVSYATADGSAKSPADYAAATGRLAIKPGERVGTIAVAVSGDTLIEPDETFAVALSRPVNATIEERRATGTITNDDLRKLVPPPDGQTYIGMFIRPGSTDEAGAKYGDTRPYTERVQDVIANELASKTPALLRVRASFWGTFTDLEPDIAEVRAVTGPENVLFLNWNLDRRYTTKDVAAGLADATIKADAAFLRSYGRPVLMVWGQEANGSWWPMLSPRANPTLTTADFVAAWRHIVDIFRAEGALNVSWAWAMNAVPPAPTWWVDTNLDAYWPGDDYVDWAGGVIYDPLPHSFLDPLYDFAVAHHKPFFLAEWGLRHGNSTLTPPQQNDWLNRMFDYIESHPAIKAFNYFNYNTRADLESPVDPAKLVCIYDGKVCYQANTNDYDHRLLADSGAGWRQTFSTHIASPRYVSTTLSEPVSH